MTMPRRSGLNTNGSHCRHCRHQLLPRAWIGVGLLVGLGLVSPHGKAPTRLPR